MTIYTSRLIVIPNYGNHLQSDSSSNSSYSYQNELFRSTLILLPNSNRKRFIQTIQVQCGNFLQNDDKDSNNKHFQSISPINTTSDIYSGDESICEYYPLEKTPIIGESYFDVRHRLLAKSNLFSHTLKDDTDLEDIDSFCCSSIGYSYHHYKLIT